jgi:hypothetical protein
MPSSYDLKYVKSIDQLFENARIIQKLTLQDLVAGGFKNPLDIANPDNPVMVAKQLQKLRNYPERYSGYTRNGELVAYMKQNDWEAGDELSFTTGINAAMLKASQALHMNPLSGQWGVLGLVAFDELDKNERDNALIGLLRRSFTDLRTGRPRIVNIVLHENDPVLSIAPRLGFVPVGVPGEASGAPGKIQQRYQRAATQ